ncbi:MAG: hypothetical protein HW400_932 [Candidatus Levybacteria bacterium]|nr:hypothetical protein [Candidatus Levybacteria bacterium]
MVESIPNKSPEIGKPASKPSSISIINFLEQEKVTRPMMLTESQGDIQRIWTGEGIIGLQPEKKSLVGDIDRIMSAGKTGCYELTNGCFKTRILLKKGVEVDKTIEIKGLKI